ncbi:unnamed protein product [Staurois parvus]|uniref:Uncharacterized protein n=1 Tax=Staurois parvus TaxID=386267 RepID=A0ABN9C7N7_9NEOB|nr:unnamed protein product [Staurois parvus]
MHRLRLLIDFKGLKVLLNPGPFIHYIWSPTVHRTWKCNYFSKYKLLNTFSDQQLEQSGDFSRALVKACRRIFPFCSKRM